MKNILLFLVASFTLLQVNAQTWTVGVPVNQTIIDYPDNILTTLYCYNLNFPNGMDQEFRLALPQVSGINYYVIIDYATNPTHTYQLRQPGVNTQSMMLGDSMQIIPTGAVDTIRVSYAGYETEVSVKFKAIGTPVAAGELYPCGSTDDGWFYQPIGCWMPTNPNPLTYLTDCVVQASVSIDGLTGSGNVVIFPNPFRINTTLFSSVKNCSVRIFDVTGKVVRNINSVTDFPLTVERGNLSAGVYVVVLRTENGNAQRVKLIVQ